MKVLVLDNVSPKAVTILEQGGLEAVVDNEKHTEEELIKMIPEYHGVIVRSASTITAPIIEAANNLVIIGRAGVGVDNIDVAAASQHGVLVVNAPDGNTIAATEQTIALMLAMARNVPQAHGALKQGKWMRKEFTGIELRNKVLGIIGLGRIGTAVAKRAQALEMTTIGYDPFTTAERAASDGIELVSLEDLYQKADIITLHIPKTKESLNMINKDSIAKMKDGVRIVNVARGGIVNEQDLYEAVKSGKVAGAALDVWTAEPTTESPLFELEKVVVCPHLGASTKEAQVNVALDVANEIVNVLSNGEMAKNAVNMPAISQELMHTLKPYLNLGEKLGKFVGQVATEFETVEISYSGDIADLDVSPITTGVVKGLLSSILDDSVNFVNAGLLAKSRGIKISEKKSGHNEVYTSLVTVTVKGKCEKSVAGTIFSNNDPRIVMVDGYRVDAVPEGYMLVAPHIDKPKIIGKVGTLIGEEEVNIATMQVGRKNLGGNAVMLLGVDGVITDKGLQEIAKVDGILEVKFVSL